MNRSFVNLQIICALLFVFLTTLSPALALAQETLDPLAQKFVDELWERSSSNRKSAKAIFETKANLSEQALYAYALNQVKQTRFAQARVPADELTQRFPKNLDGWVLRIWLDTLTNKYDRALIGIQLLKRQIDDAADLEEAKREEISLRVARILGYLQGPVTRSTDAMTLQDTLVKFTTGMSPEQLTNFNDESARILDEYDQRVKDTADLENQEIAKAQVAQDQEIKNLQASNQQLDQRRQQLQPERDRLRQESDQKISAIDTRLSPMQAELAGIDSSITSLQITYQGVFNELSLIQNQLLRTNDPVVRTLLIRDLNRVEIDATAINNDIVNLKARWRTVAVQVDQLALERNRIAQNASRQLKQLDNESNQINRQQRRNSSSLTKLAQGPPKVGNKIRGSQIDAEALRSYDPFPIELYRQRFLDQFSNN